MGAILKGLKSWWMCQPKYTLFWQVNITDHLESVINCNSVVNYEWHISYCDHYKHETNLSYLPIET